MYFFVVLAAPKNDAADLVTAVPVRCGYVLSMVQSLDFLDIQFNFRVLRLPNCVRHKGRRFSLLVLSCSNLLLVVTHRLRNLASFSFLPVGLNARAGPILRL
jgi:hypothetical protein